MPVEMIGWIAPRVSSEVLAPSGPPFNAEVIAATARIHEKADFDRVLIGYFSDAPDGFLVGAHAATVTKRLGLLLAHRPGFVSPTLAARKLATLDHLSGGRLAVHIIAGGSDADQAKDGDFTDHAGRYRRVSEYIAAPTTHLDVDRLPSTMLASSTVCRAPIPTSAAGRAHTSQSMVAADRMMRSRRSRHMSATTCCGASRCARRRHSWRRSARRRWLPASLRRASACRRGRSWPQTDDKAWDRARDILRRVQAQRGGAPPPKPENLGSQRLLSAAAASEVHDTCLWMKLAEATGARGNSTALVGAPDTVAKALLAYYKLGAGSLLIRGYEPLEDAEQYGAELIPLVRKLVAEADAQSLGLC